MSQYEVLLFDTDKEEVQAIVPILPGCKARGATDAEALANLRAVLNDMLQRVRWTTVEVEPTPPAENPLPFSDEELEEIATCGPDHLRYWDALEAVGERFNAELDRKGYTLKEMLTDLPAARRVLWEQKYSSLLQKARKAQVTDG